MTCHHHSVKKRNRQGCRRILFMVIWGIAASYTVFRLVEMVLSNTLFKSSSGGLGPQASALASSGDLKSGPIRFPSITLCNINPARGSELVKLHASLFNVTNVYENFVDFIKHRSPIRSGHVPLKLIYENAGHMIKDMLKSCQFNDEKACHFYNFSKSVTLGGLCFTLEPKDQNITKLKLLVDPQGYDYMLPNEGFVGLVLLVHSKSEPLVLKLDQSLQVGPKFYTTIHVSAKRVAFPGRCTTEFAWKSCLDDCFANQILSKCKCSLTGLPTCTLRDLAKCSIQIDKDISTDLLSSCHCDPPCSKVDYKIQSVVQTPRSPLLSRLQTIKERDSLSRRVEVVKEANLVQQWAFLREANYSAFKVVETMAGLLTKVHKKYGEAVLGLRQFYIVWNTRYVKNHHYGRNCMTLLEAIAKSLDRMYAKAREVEDFSKTIFFQSPFTFPYSDATFRVIYTFYKYTPERVSREMEKYELGNFYQDLSSFDITFQQFTDEKCDRTAPNDGHRFLQDHEAQVKIKMSEIKSNFQIFVQLFKDIYENNKAIRTAYPTSMSKIKQIASPNFVSISLKFQREYSVEVIPERVSLVQAKGSDRVLLLITSVLSISLFCTLLVYWLTKLSCKSLCRHQQQVKNIRPRPRVPLPPSEEEESLSFPTLLLQQQQAATGTLQRKQPRPVGEFDCALTSVSNNDYDDGWM